MGLGVCTVIKSCKASFEQHFASTLISLSLNRTSGCKVMTKKRQFTRQIHLTISIQVDSGPCSVMGESFDPRLDAHDLSDTADDRSLMITTRNTTHEGIKFGVTHSAMIKPHVRTECSAWQSISKSVYDNCIHTRMWAPSSRTRHVYGVCVHSLELSRYHSLSAVMTPPPHY